MPKRDPQGYYAALNVSPDATTAEIRLAYKFIKLSYQARRRKLDIGKIRTAFAVLSDPRARRRYDRGETDGSSSLAWTRSISPRQVLVPALGVSLIVLFLLVGPSFRAHFRSFGPGDEVYWVENGEDLGKVLSFDREHRFPSGSVAPAFEILPVSGEAPVWYPARDLKRYGRAR